MFDTAIVELSCGGHTNVRQIILGMTATHLAMSCRPHNGAGMFALIVNIMTTSSIVTRISINVGYHASSSCQNIYIYS